VCSIEYLTTQIKLVCPAFSSWTVHKIIEYLTLGLLSSLSNIYRSTTAYFLTHPVYSVYFTSHHAAAAVRAVAAITVSTCSRRLLYIHLFIYIRLLVQQLTKRNFAVELQ